MKERQKEQQHVDETIALIRQEQQLLLRQRKQLSKETQEQLKDVANRKIRGGSDEAFYESVIEYQQHEQELLLKYQTSEMQEKRLSTLETMTNSPYFARIDFTEDKEKETLYLGIASLRATDEETIVIDWRAPIANLYYEGELGETYYETDTDKINVSLLLKRQFKIQEGHILSMVDTADVINDEFLLEILDETSSAQMKNIVATIQKAQNQIIRDTTSKNLLIEGIAGSGKTSALLQRIAFILYRNRKWLSEKQVLLFSPNRLFSDYISMVLPSLGESEVPTRTFAAFIQMLLPSFMIQKEQQQEESFLSGSEDRIEKLKSSLKLTNLIAAYTSKITGVGPLFKDLKINGQTYIKKEQIRSWYHETNQQLPLYQRSQLLQSRLLKKLGGLEKDESKKAWVKEAAEEKLQQLFSSNPHQEYTEENERRLKNQLKRQLVKKKFRGITRGVKNFQFINVSKQYLHFLQSVPKSILEKTGISQEEWQLSLQSLRRNLANRTLTQEDAVLFFLLTKNLYPVAIEQKARFIFIDEMQDFPPAQVLLLRNLYPKANITLCGDLNQKVLGNETIVGTLDQLFPDQTITRYQLKTSYRSTKEITDFANQFLTNGEEIDLTARNGNKPAVYLLSKQKARQKLEAFIAQPISSHWRLAILCKTTAACRKLYDSLSDVTKKQTQLIVSEEDLMRKPIMIFPAFLAKGLEFDQVVVWTGEDEFCSQQDQLIFYTMVTRGMHEVSVICQEKLPRLLTQANPDTYQLIEE